jgi:hypothetical protein
MAEFIKKTISSIFTGGLKKFKGIEQGASCYIFGDGPSIKFFDLKNFKDKPSICCGMIPFHIDFKELNVRYITLVEPWFFAPDLAPKKSDVRATRTIMAKYLEVIRANRDREFFVNLTNFPILSGANINYVLQTLPGEASFRKGLGASFNPFQGSFHAVLSLAYYMGFSEVYLVGFDAWTIQPSKTSRWYEKGEGLIYKTENFAFDFLEEIKKKIDIYTISAYGDSVNVKNIPYSIYTGQPPVFRENYQLMEDQYLRALASYPGHKIF